VTVSQDQALADERVFQLNVPVEFPIDVPYVKLDQVTVIFCRVTLPEAQLLRVEDQSITL